MVPQIVMYLSALSECRILQPSAQYNWNSNSHIKLGAIVRSMTYSSNVHDKAFSTTGFGLQASTTFNVTKKWQVFGQILIMERESVLI